jgi:hypothetical protein
MPVYHASARNSSLPPWRCLGAALGGYSRRRNLQAARRALMMHQSLSVLLFYYMMFIVSLQRWITSAAR